MSDRTVHAKLANGDHIVRYNRAGKWYIEHAEGGRRALTVHEAAGHAARAAEWFPGRPGGQSFDAKVRAALAAKR